MLVTLSSLFQVGNGGLTPAQERSHVTMWAALKSPLMISTDLSTISPASLALLTNKGMINVNQDPLGVQARRIWSNTDTGERVGSGMCDDQPQAPDRRTMRSCVKHL